MLFCKKSLLIWEMNPVNESYESEIPDGDDLTMEELFEVFI